jgi:hypothetical protein
MTPTRDQLNRTHAKAWLLQFATPEALRSIYISMMEVDGPETYDSRMVQVVHLELTGQEIRPDYEAIRQLMEAAR